MPYHFNLYNNLLITRQGNNAFNIRYIVTRDAKRDARVPESWKANTLL